MSDYISHDHEHDGIDRRGFLHCMAWAGTGLLWTISGGVLASKTLAQIAKAGEPLPATDLSFLQISDSHIGFNKEANKDVTATFKIALDRINAMPTPPSFLIHTGDITQLSKPEEFDTFDEVLKSCRTKDVFYVPGEHDVLNDGGKLYRERALGYLKRFGSVTVLNGHIHQVLQKVEGNVTFHTAMSTAFPQPAPGTAASPGPMKVPAEKLRSMLGLTSVQYKQGKTTLAVVDSNLS